jgi:type II secretion system protein H
VVPERVCLVDRRGFSAAELLVVVAIVAVVTASSAPWMLSYWRSASLRAGAEELSAGLNNGRQLAIAQARSVCVEVTNNQYRFRIGGCSGAAWTGPGTAANGFFRLMNNMGVATNVNPVFDYLGAAAPGATMTVTSPQDGRTLLVVVSPAGRVRICPAVGPCP